MWKLAGGGRGRERGRNGGRKEGGEGGEGGREGGRKEEREGGGVEKDVRTVLYLTAVCSLLPVVVDRRENKNCDTGKFELAYKQVTPTDMHANCYLKHKFKFCPS